MKKFVILSILLISLAAAQEITGVEETTTVENTVAPLPPIESDIASTTEPAFPANYKPHHDQRQYHHGSGKRPMPSQRPPHYNADGTQTVFPNDIAQTDDVKLGQTEPAFPGYAEGQEGEQIQEQFRERRGQDQEGNEFEREFRGGNDEEDREEKHIDGQHKMRKHHKDRKEHDQKRKCFWKKLSAETKILIIGLLVLAVVMSVKYYRLRKRLQRQQQQQQSQPQQQQVVQQQPLQVANNAVRLSNQQDYVILNTSNSLQNTMPVYQPQNQNLELQPVRAQNEQQQRQLYPQIQLGQPVILQYPQQQ